MLHTVTTGWICLPATLKILLMQTFWVFELQLCIVPNIIAPCWCCTFIQEYAFPVGDSNCRPKMLTFICQQVRLFWKKIKLLKFSKSLIQAQIVSAWPWIWEGIFRSGNKIREWNPSILQRIRETWREIFYFIGSFIFRWGTSTHLWLNALWLTALNGNWLRWMPLRRNTTQALHRDRSDQTCSIILRLVLFPSPLSPEGKPVREKWGIKQRNLSRPIEQMRQNSFFFFRWGE